MEHKEALGALLKSYKFIVDDEQEQVKKITGQDIDEPLVNYNLNLDHIVKKSYAELINNDKKRELLMSKIDLLPSLVDSCFETFMKILDDECPLKSLPRTLFKYNLMTSMIKKQHYGLVLEFRWFLKDEFGKSLMMLPPIYIREEVELEELMKKIKSDFLPRVKKIINQLLVL